LDWDWLRKSGSYVLEVFWSVTRNRELLLNARAGYRHVNGSGLYSY
jgi:hypothetical protein